MAQRSSRNRSFAMSAEKNIGSQARSRREFVRAGVGIGAAGVAALTSIEELFAKENPRPRKSAKSLIGPGDTILFQGDSITDAGRKRDAAGPNVLLGLGDRYAWLTAAELLIDKPDGKLKIYNRGVSGNKVYQLAERWQTDCLDLRPNVLSVL